MIVADALVLNRHQAISNYADDVCHINFITPQAKSHLINNARKRSGCRRAAWRWLCVIGRYIYRWYFLHWKSVYFYSNFTDIGPKGSISQQWVSIGRKPISVTDSLVVKVNTRCARFFLKQSNIYEAEDSSSSVELEPTISQFLWTFPVKSPSGGCYCS